MSHLFSSCLVVAAALLLSVVLHAPLARADIPADLIDTLPGYGKPRTVQYSGFLPADANNTVFLHYWLVTSSNHPATDPVVVWMNGGPGCSSLLGLLVELGPYTFTGANDSVSGVPMLKDNPYSWTTSANVLFLEQPAGVGFSYAVNGTMASDDFIQSQNSYGFLLNFFKAFPEFSKQPFYVTGESYAGIYVPTLALRIIDGNDAGMPHINLQGIAVGDGCMGNSIGTCGNGGDAIEIQMDFFYSHAMISPVVYSNVSALCGDYQNPSQQCQDAANTAIGNVGDIDIYNVYDVCPGNNDDLPRSSPLAWQRVPNRLVNHLKDPIQCLAGGVLGPPPLWLNSPIVKKALHVDRPGAPATWNPCSDLDYDTNLVSLIPDYPKLISHMNVLIYSGTTPQQLTQLLPIAALIVLSSDCSLVVCFCPSTRRCRYDMIEHTLHIHFSLLNSPPPPK